MSLITLNEKDVLSFYIAENYKHKYVICLEMNSNKILQNHFLQQHNICPPLNCVSLWLFNTEQESLHNWNKIKQNKQINISLWGRGIFIDRNK